MDKQSEIMERIIEDLKNPESTNTQDILKQLVIAMNQFYHEELSQKAKLAAQKRNAKKAEKSLVIIDQQNDLPRLPIPYIGK